MLSNNPNPQDVSMRLPLQFIVLGLLAFVSANLLFWLSGQELLTGVYRTPSLWSVVHQLLNKQSKPTHAVDDEDIRRSVEADLWL